LEKKSQSGPSIKGVSEDKISVIRKAKYQKRLEAESRQKVSSQRKLFNEQIEQLESKMDKLEAEKKEIESNLAEPNFYRDQTKAAEAGKRYQELQKLIPKLFDEWEIRQTKLEMLLSEIK
jgi:ATP-binding cassette subfamily F protein 3